MTEIDLHDSDCATHNEPAYPNGPCDCSLLTTTERDAAHGGYDDAKRRNETKMTNPDELERAVEALGRGLVGVLGSAWVPGLGQCSYDDLRLILSANREMQESLRPFAALADMVGESWTDETPAFVGADGVTITIGQLRKARSALTTQRGDGE